MAVIVQGATPAEAQRAAVSLEVAHRYTIIPAFAGSVTAGQVTALTRIPTVSRVELDGLSRAVDAAGDHDYGVQEARVATPGLDGAGVGLCVVDTGIDPNHEQLDGRVVGWKDWVNGRAAPYDDHGHGTHVASIAAGDGTGAVGATADAYGGVARAASLIGAKVLTSSGSGADSDVVAAVDWCAQRPDVRIISLSLGSPAGDGGDAASVAVNAAVGLGKVVVVAAGNDGDGEGTVSSPGVATGAITAGAGSDYTLLPGGLDTDSGLYLAGFSGRGPTANPQATLKPDVVAPGVSVVAARAGTTAGYVAYSGTSMATPFVAGVVALGLDAVPLATPAQVKTALQASAKDAGPAGADYDWGHGYVDARAFLDRLLGSEATPASWPGRVTTTSTVPDGGRADVPLVVVVPGQPLAVTVKVSGTQACSFWFLGLCLAWEWSPDLDATLISPTGAQIAVSRCPLEATNANCGTMGRFESVSVPAADAGTWTLRLVPFADAPNNGKGGAYTADVFGAVSGAVPPPPPPDTAPSAPSGLTATAPARNRVVLSWTDNASNETGFRIERCKGATCTRFVQLATVGVDTTTFTDASVAANTTYRYRVRASNGAGTSAYSTIATVTTPKR